MGAFDSTHWSLWNLKQTKHLRTLVSYHPPRHPGQKTIGSLSRIHRHLLITACFACWIPPQALKRKVPLVRANLLLLPLKCISAVSFFTLLFFKCCIFPTIISSSHSYLLYQPCSPQTPHLTPILFSQYRLAVKSKFFILLFLGGISLLSCSHLLSQSVFFLIFSHACQSVCPIPDDSPPLPPGSPSNLSTLSLGSFLQLLFIGSFLSCPFLPSDRTPILQPTFN